ncbi:hypothetical protein BDZ89DRAFT_233370 [Hymenopellis radicata]|nr:hypothetical protein BDZ89DRAFT_233370 [Hymenopellis radicata]
MSTIARSNSHHAESSASAVSTTPIALYTYNASPIQELPNELLEEIFLYHMPPNGFKALCVRNDCWSLVNVCQSWRDVATHCPRLWRHIDVRVRILKCSNPVALLSLVVSRAQAMDLFITFDASPGEDDAGNVVDNPNALTLALFKVLVERSAQWRTIQLIELDTPCIRVLEGVRDRLPRLAKLDVQPHVEADWGTLGYTTAPLLKSVTLFFSGEAVAVVDRIPGQVQLTEFRLLDAYYDSSLVSLLRHCPLLKALDMRFFSPSPPVDKRVRSQITDFTFDGRFFSELTLVHLPQLRTLSIGHADGISLETSILPSLLDLLKYSRCPLESLDLINCDLAGLAAVLELVPHLQDLVIVFRWSLPDTETFVSGVDEALSALMTDLEKVDLVPNLQQLRSFSVSRRRVCRRSLPSSKTKG